MRTILKYDGKLGQEIHQLLIANQLENELDFNQYQKSLYDEQELINAWSNLLVKLGYNNDNTLTKQAERLTDFYLNDRFLGLDYAKFPKITPLANTQNYHEPLIARNIEFISTCEHHLVPINGIALIAYKPADVIIGLNKLNVVLEFFAKRPQLQERLTRQVSVVLKHILKTEDVAVIINAKHNCMSLECVDNSTEHLTFEFSGIFKADASYRELLFLKI